MRKSLQNFFLAGLATVGCMMLNSTNAQAQHDFDWGNWDIPYIEQKGFALGVQFGQTDLWADVGTKSIIDHYWNDVYRKDVFANMRFMGGFFVRYTHNPGISFRMGVNYGALYATDAWNREKALKAKTLDDDVFQRYVRNLDVSTNIWEGNLLFEFSPFRISNWEFGRLAKARTQPYLLIGVAGFHFNPKGTLKDYETNTQRLIELQPLHTEGQNFNAPGHSFPGNYSLWSYAAVAGIGVKWDIGKSLALGLEYQLRYTFTDYLDDVSGTYIDPQHAEIGFLNDPDKIYLSQRMADKSWEVFPGYQHQPGDLRGNASNKDMYSTVSVVFYWKIDKRKSPWWIFGK